MSYATINVDGDNLENGIEEAEDMTLTVDFDEETNRCKYCGESLADYGTGGMQDDNGDTFCQPRADAEEDVDDDYDEDGELLHPERFVHESDGMGVTWCNGAGIIVSEDGARVSVWISLGDPRGAFQMTASRVELRDDDNSPTGKFELRLSTPDPTDALPHMKLTQLSEGYFRAT